MVFCACYVVLVFRAPVVAAQRGSFSSTGRTGVASVSLRYALCVGFDLSGQPHPACGGAHSLAQGCLPRFVTS